MGKKIAIGAFVLIFAGIIFLPDILYFSAKKAFAKENREKAWAKKTAYNAGKMYQRFFRFKSALNVYHKCIKTWPDVSWRVECEYRIAFCYERSGQSTKAIAAYEAFIAGHPDSPMVGQAGRRLTYARANE
jgi:outer membrane protein assembly factor BamD (BamD/ComL family)